MSILSDIILGLAISCLFVRLCFEVMNKEER
mgnify:CR=1 FL=1